MSVQTKAVAVALALLSGSVAASGWRGPAHLQLLYSFTCAGGAIGHASYSRDAAPERDSLTLWVNGAYLQSDEKLAPLLSGRSVQSLSASCDGGTTVIFIGTWDPEAAKEGSVTVHVDDSGRVISAGV